MAHKAVCKAVARIVLALVSIGLTPTRPRRLREARRTLAEWRAVMRRADASLAARPVRCQRSNSPACPSRSGKGAIRKTIGLRRLERRAECKQDAGQPLQYAAGQGLHVAAAVAW
jgi:hypothetical protein